ncbi:TPA: hypothetical protein ACSE6Y_003751, partial [Acinetobacter baumannii]
IIDYSDLELGFKNRDYKTEQLMHDAFQNLLNEKKWLYLGADISNHEWVKIGITAGDLRSRSYSSANPNYYIFCAFQFKYNVTIEEMRKVEMDIHYKFDQDFIKDYGISKRLGHYESGRPSECYFPVDFSYVFEKLHYELFHNYSLYFYKIGYENEIGDEHGATLYCEFSPTIPIGTKKSLLQKIMQW